MRDAAKAEVQQKFWDQLHLKVDLVRQIAGTFNDGNTYRRFFENPSLTAQITIVDERLIDRFGTILDAINSHHEIDVGRFEEFCRETAELYVELYPWYPMNNTVHKILIHVAQIITSVSGAAGSLSEEAQEALKKIWRYNRQYHARKCDRESTNADVIHHMLALTDLRLHNFMRPPPTTSREVKEKVAPLLKNDVPPTSDPLN